MELDWLYSFQREDVLKLADRKGILVANEMGTGKTYQAIALDLLRREQWVISQSQNSWFPTLIVAPLTTLRSTWKTHLEELAPDLRTTVINPKNRGAFLRAVRDEEFDVFVCHWESLRLMPELQKVFWFHIVADEVH